MYTQAHTYIYIYMFVDSVAFAKVSLLVLVSRRPTCIVFVFKPPLQHNVSTVPRVTDMQLWVYKHTYIYIYIYIHTTYMCVLCGYTHVYVCMCICVYIYIYTYVLIIILLLVVVVVVVVVSLYCLLCSLNLLV